MHIALVISSLNSGGSERVLSQLANYLSLKGHRISLITLSSPAIQPFYPLDSSIHLIQLNQNQAEISFIKRIKNIFKRISCVRKTLKKQKPDVIISFVDMMNITTLFSTLGFKIPIIISERIDPNFHFIPTLYAWLRLKVYPFCYKLIVQTENAARYFPPDFKSIIKIIPNPVPFPQKNLIKISKKVQNIIAVGRLESQKDHATLIHSFSNLLYTYPDLNLTIYGEGNERHKLETLIFSLGLESKVFLPGTTSNIHEALLNADLFIFPSLYEGFPNALCEAMAMGLPVIASNCSGNVDVVQEGIDGRLFPIGNIKALTDITLEMLADYEQRKRLAKNAQKICIRFHFERIFKEWDQIITDAAYS